MTFDKEWDRALESREHYRRDAGIDDLNDAIAAFRACLEAPCEDCMRRIVARAALAQTLSWRYWQRYRIADLEEALSECKRSLELAPQNLAGRGGMLLELGTLLGEDARVRGRIESLDEAVKTLSDASKFVRYNLAEIQRKEAAEPTIIAGELQPPLIASVTGQQAIIYRERYLLGKRKRDLKRAIKQHERALSIVKTFPRGSFEMLTGIRRPSPALFFYQYGTSLRVLARSRRGGGLDTLREAIEWLFRAVRLKPDPIYFETLGKALVEHARLSGDRRFDPEATAAFRESCERGMRLTPLTALKAARAWGRWVFERDGSDARQAPAMAEAVEAYSYARAALESVMRVQVVRDDKATALRSQGGLTGEIAYVLASAGHLSDAVDATEAGVSRLIGEAMQQGILTLDHLTRSGHADLRTRYERAVDGLRGSDSDRAYDELGEVTEAIRLVPGCEEFLAAPKLRDIARLLDSRTSLVYLIASPWGGLALVVDADATVTPVWISGLTDAAVRDRVSRLRDRLEPGPERRRARAIEELVRWLGDILERDLFSTQYERAERILLVPVGLVSALPIHASCIANSKGGMRFVADSISVAYAPSAAALLRTQRARCHKVENALVVVDPSLEYGEDDVTAVQAYLDEKTVKVLRPPATTRDHVLAALPLFTLCHFACHAKAILQDPTKSAIKLPAGEELAAGDLWEQNLNGVRLLVLASCESALSGTALEEEAISLPSLMLQAGVGGIVGTLWSVRDDCAAEIVKRMYARLASGRPDPPSVLWPVAKEMLLDGYGLADVAAFVCLGG